MKRDTAQTIFRTVVFAGAMLGSGCSKKPTTPSTIPTNSNPTETGTQPDTATPTGTDTATPDPCASADPCAGGERPRGTDDDGGGGTGRGFVLS
ncbi:MAG: hypothetical protein JWP01_3834 [Myxococcales bacterium]|nr:hypothetical protein [Myxococcales bacterium]